jgi:hypothetical protein
MKVLYKMKYFLYMIFRTEENPMSDIHEDITFMRTMAEQGRRGPIIGGAFLAAAGLVFGSTAFVQWGWQTGALPQGGLTIFDLWAGADIGFTLIWVVLLLRLRAHFKQGESGAPGAAQKVFGSVWGGCGLGVCVLIGAIANMSWHLHDSTLMRIAPLAAFAFYGSAWFVVGMLARKRWMFMASSASFILTLVMPMVSDAATLPVLGAGLLVTLLLPGIGLMREAAR